MSRWCNIELHVGCFALFSHLETFYLIWASWQQGVGTCQRPENGTCEEVPGRRGITWWNLDTVQEAARNERLAAYSQALDTCFHGVWYWLPLSKHPPDVSVGRTESSILSLATVFCQETWTSTYNDPQGQLERLQSQFELPATSNHLSASDSQLGNRRAQSPCPRSESGEQHGRLQGSPFRYWSGCPPEPPS